ALPAIDQHLIVERRRRAEDLGVAQRVVRAGVDELLPALLIGTGQAAVLGDVAAVLGLERQPPVLRQLDQDPEYGRGEREAGFAVILSELACGVVETDANVAVKRIERRSRREREVGNEDVVTAVEHGLRVGQIDAELKP